MSAFVKECLQPIVKHVSDDIVDYILSIKEEDDYHDFMASIVDPNDQLHMEMYDKLKWHVLGHKNSKSSGSNKYQGKEKSNSDNNISSNILPGKGKKMKYVNFYGQDSRPGLRKGRQPCDCQATKHDLINNCRKCGRIVCEQEGSGPCFFCDNMVCTRYEMEILDKNTKQSDVLYNQLLEQKKSKEWKRAIENRNRLIKTDLLGVTKNKVFDDQNDYFDVNSSWLAADEENTKKKRIRGLYETFHRSRQDMKLALDFASRTVSIDDSEKRQTQNLLKGVNKLLDNSERRFPKDLFSGEKGQLIEEIVKLMDETSLKEKKKSTNAIDIKKEIIPRKYRIANNDFLESVDQGMCLSMHQPWASLLIAGIKVHEGRTWKTEHRGRLWIAAAAKEPDHEEILACEQMYRELYNDPSLEFPKKYPTGCLLGCVIIEDCLAQNEYKQRYPKGESDSPYVFICAGPVILHIFYPMQGQHKIFQLPKELHRTAKAALMSSKWV